MHLIIATYFLETKFQIAKQFAIRFFQSSVFLVAQQSQNVVADIYQFCPPSFIHNPSNIQSATRTLMTPHTPEPYLHREENPYLLILQKSLSARTLSLRSFLHEIQAHKINNGNSKCLKESTFMNNFYVLLCTFMS